MKIPRLNPPMAAIALVRPIRDIRKPTAGLVISWGHIVRLARKPEEARLKPEVLRNLGVNVKREITEALKNSQANPTSQISVPAALTLSKIPSDDTGILEWSLGEDLKNKRNAQKAMKGKTALSHTLMRQPNSPPTKENTFKERIVPRGIEVLRSPIAKPSCRPLNHWARA